MTEILIAVGIVAVIGISCALLLVVASQYMHVKTDETESRLRACLPGANCGACGFAGCDGYAKALAAGGVASNLCIPGADVTSRAISAILGTAFEDVVEKVAFVKCMGDCLSTEVKYEYSGAPSCRAAGMLWGGAGKCVWGCLGFGDCAAVCPNGAICIENGIAHVDARKCTGCGLCAKTCPKNLISLMDDVEKVMVTCSNRDRGAVARKNCSNACIGCKKCENNCPAGAIQVTDNLAVIDYEKCIDCGLCAKNCPVDCIKISDFSGIHRYLDTEAAEEAPLTAAK